MADFVRRNSLSIVCVFLLLASFQLMSLSVANPKLARSGVKLVDSLLFPMQKAYHEVAESTKYVWNRYISLINVEEQRDTLLSQVNELEARNSRLMEFENENKLLRKILKFTEETEHRGVIASVIGRDPSNWVKTILIDRGSSSGLKEGLPVVDGNALVGKTISVTKDSSRVLLLSDNTSAIDAIVQNSRAWGIAEGNISSQMLSLRYVEKLKESEVKVGDRVISSGVDGVYPKGILIGVVEKVTQTTTGLFQDIKLKPSVDFSRLESVMVIVPQKTVAIKQNVKEVQDQKIVHESNTDSNNHRNIKND